MSAGQPFAIAVAPNGARRTKADHPALPMTVPEIARDAAETLEAGAAMIHLHVRDRDGAHTLDADLYREAIAAVRTEVGDGLVVQITTEAVGRYAPAEQIAVVDAVAPESVSVALREIVPDADAESAAAAFFERTCRRGTLVQFIIYEPDEVARLDDLSQRDVLPEAPLAVLAVLGRYSGTGAAPAEFDAFMQTSLSAHRWMLCAFGSREAAFMKRAASAGGHARVGFENNLLLPGGRIAPSNAALVSAAAEAGRESGRRVAIADELRRLWNMPADA